MAPRLASREEEPCGDRPRELELEPLGGLCSAAMLRKEEDPCPPYVLCILKADSNPIPMSLPGALESSPQARSQGNMTLVSGKSAIGCWLLSSMIWEQEVVDDWFFSSSLF